ncbi:TPA: hypothetical protein DEB00_01080 [Candidatus Uhrbacteria bacterium]|nr:hypothetical protein [Candidatus Uhrbacteria bacterium]
MKNILAKAGNALLAGFVWLAVRLWRGLCLVAAWVWSHTVVATYNAARRSSDFRRGMIAGAAWAMVAGVLILATPRIINWSGDTMEDIRVPVINPAEPRHVTVVRAERSKLRGFNKDILPHVLEEYNTYVGNGAWRTGAERCLQQMEMFRRAESMTLYPAALIAGIALHESEGCNMAAKDRMGGRGWMQLTNISVSRHVRPAAVMLHLPMTAMEHKTNPEHNMLVGIMVLDDYERRLGSRPHGFLAYNEGVGGVRRDAREAGWRRGRPLPTVTDMRPWLALNTRYKPRIYVPRVLATALMMKRLVDGKPLVRLDRVQPEDIPGWDPRNDGTK